MAARGRPRRERDWGLVRVHIERMAREGASVEALAARYHCSWKTMRGLFEGWGLAMPKKSNDLAARNERIIAMAKQGAKDAAIVRALIKDYPEMTRGICIGIRHRNGLATTGREGEKSRKQGGGLRALEEKLNRKRLGIDDAPIGKMKTPPKPPSMAPRLEAPMLQDLPINEKAPPVPKGGRWVPWHEADGCRWIAGDVREGTAVVCNAPKCQVVRVGDPAKLRFNTSYCAQHWEARRGSKHTRVVAR